jgi:hypothetical protein
MRHRMTPTARAFALTAGVVLLVGCGQVYARPTPSYNAPQGPFIPFVVSMPTAAPTASPRASETPTATPAAMPSPSATPRPRPPQITRATHRSTASPRTSHSVSGVATWYCWPNGHPASVCTHGYPASGAYAAAGPELRAALGPHYKGKMVWVNGVTVRLVDFCACGGNHVIDVYHSTWITIPNPSRVTVRW